MNLGRVDKQPGMSFVALSRVRHLSDLMIEMQLVLFAYNYI